MGLGLIQTYSAHGHEVLDIAVSDDNARFASVGGDRQVFLWDVAQGRTLRRWSGHGGRVNCVGFGGDGGGVVGSGEWVSKYFPLRNENERDVKNNAFVLPYPWEGEKGKEESQAYYAVGDIVGEETVSHFLQQLTGLPFLSCPSVEKQPAYTYFLFDRILRRHRPSLGHEVPIAQAYSNPRRCQGQRE